MKKLFSYTLVILIITLSLNISGCSVKNNENDSHIRFYCLKDGATTHIGGYDPLKDIIRKYNAKCDQINRNNGWHRSRYFNLSV